MCERGKDREGMNRDALNKTIAVSELMGEKPIAHKLDNHTVRIIANLFDKTLDTLDVRYDYDYSPAERIKAVCNYLKWTKKCVASFNQSYKN